MDLTKTQKETRRVHFLSDYNPSGQKGKAIFKKEETHYMHFSVLKKIQNRGAKVEVEDIDWVAETEAAKLAFEEAEEAEAKSK